MSDPRDADSDDEPEGLSARCSFCLKSSRDADTLIEGPNRSELGAVYICLECVELGAAIFESRKQTSLATDDEPVGSPIDMTTRNPLEEKIDQVLTSLTVLEREIIKLRYGLGDGYTYTLEEVGTMFNLTPEQVREIESRAVNTIRSQNQPPLEP
jgi:RNA polymerase sigma factor (sigma-70 family)